MTRERATEDPAPSLLRLLPPFHFHYNEINIYNYIFELVCQKSAESKSEGEETAARKSGVTEASGTAESRSEQK